jgi:hypothetical protein
MMSASMYRTDGVGRGAGPRGEARSRRPRDDNPEVIFAVASLGVFTGLAGVLLAIGRPEK